MRGKLCVLVLFASLASALACVLLLFVASLLATAQQKDAPKPKSYDNGGVIRFNPITPACDLNITDGKRTATINFCGKSVTYSGDLPVDQSAKLFFDMVLRRTHDCDEKKPEKK